MAVTRATEALNEVSTRSSCAAGGGEGAQGAGGTDECSSKGTGEEGWIYKVQRAEQRNTSGSGAPACAPVQHSGGQCRWPGKRHRPPPSPAPHPRWHCIPRRSSRSSPSSPPPTYPDERVAVRVQLNVDVVLRVSRLDLLDWIRMGRLIRSESDQDEWGTLSIGCSGHTAPARASNSGQSQPAITNRERTPPRPPRCHQCTRTASAACCRCCRSAGMARAEACGASMCPLRARQLSAQARGGGRGEAVPARAAGRASGCPAGSHCNPARCSPAQACLQEVRLQQPLHLHRKEKRKDSQCGL